MITVNWFRQCGRGPVQKTRHGPRNRRVPLCNIEKTACNIKMSGDNQILRPRYVNLEELRQHSLARRSLPLFPFLSILVFQKQKKKKEKRRKDIIRHLIISIASNAFFQINFRKRSQLRQCMFQIFGSRLPQVAILEEKSISSPPVPLAVSTAYNQPSSLTKRLCRLRPRAPVTGHTHGRGATHVVTPQFASLNRVIFPFKSF